MMLLFALAAASVGCTKTTVESVESASEGQASTDGTTALTSSTGTASSSGGSADADTIATEDPLPDTCPPAVQGLENRSAFHDVPPDWPWEEQSSIEEAVCEGIERSSCDDCFDVPHEILRMNCVKASESGAPHDIQLFTALPEVVPALDSILDEDSVVLRFIGNPSSVGNFTVRSMDGELILLHSYDVAVRPGETLGFGGAAEYGAADWSAPFGDLTLVDGGCTWRPSPVDTWPEQRLPYALDFIADNGPMQVFDRTQGVATLAGTEYHVVVPWAAELDPPAPPDLAMQVELVIVR